MDEIVPFPVGDITYLQSQLVLAQTAYGWQKIKAILSTILNVIKVLNQNPHKRRICEEKILDNSES